MRVTFQIRQYSKALVDSLLYPGSDRGILKLGLRIRPRRTCPVVVRYLQKQVADSPGAAHRRVSSHTGWFAIAGLVERCLVLNMQGTSA
jgi:hypothetical protein